MAQITDDLILECVIFDGTPSKNAICNYVASMTDLPREKVRGKTHQKLKSLATYGVLKEIEYEGWTYYCFPDCKPAPRKPDTDNIQARIREHIQRLPEGAQFSILELQDRFLTDRSTVYDVVKSLGGLKYTKLTQAPYYVYTKGAIA